MPSSTANTSGPPKVTPWWRRTRIVTAGSLSFLVATFILSELARRFHWTPRRWSTPDFPGLGSLVVGLLGAVVVTSVVVVVMVWREDR